VNWVLSLHPEVWDDIDDAIEYYADVEVSLPERFLMELDVAFDFAERFPLSGRPLYTKYRRIVLKHFPYIVCYRVIDKTVRVLAIVHGRRDPKWVRRKLAARS